MCFIEVFVGLVRKVEEDLVYWVGLSFASQVLPKSEFDLRTEN